MITAAQLRAARGLLDWTRNELAEAAKISPETVKNIEHGVFRPQEQTADAIIKAFAAHGVEFTADEGVRLRKDSVTRLEGTEGFRRFIDDVYIAAQQQSAAEGGNKPIYISSVDDRLFKQYLGDYLPTHIKRMNDLKTVKMRILIQDRPYTSTPEEATGNSYREYRVHPVQSLGNVPFYVYGDKLGILTFEGENAPQIVVISSPLVSKAYREQFEIIWQSAKKIEKAYA